MLCFVACLLVVAVIIRRFEHEDDSRIKVQLANELVLALNQRNAASDLYFAELETRQQQVGESEAVLARLRVSLTAYYGDHPSDFPTPESGKACFERLQRILWSETNP